MTKSDHFGLSAMVAAAVLAVVLMGLHSSAAAQTTGGAQYTVTDLETLTGATSSGAEAISDSGQVAGWSGSGPDTLDTHGFVWESGVMTDLGTLGGGDYSRAFDVNDSGQVVGESSYPVGPNGNGPTKAFLWQSGQMTDLGALLGDPEEESHAHAINGPGQVVGESRTQDQNGGFWDHAFLWQNGVMTDLGILAPDGDPGNSVAYGINDSGQVVGEADLEDFAGTHAFLYENGQMTDLGALNGGNFSVAYDINASAQVVGMSGTAGFIWQNGAMTALNGIEPAAVNDASQVVGRTGYGGGEGLDYHASIWQGGQVENLNDLIDPASGWNLKKATDISDSGQIVGTGIVGGQERAFLLTPVPDTAAPTVSVVPPKTRNGNFAAKFSEPMEKSTLVQDPNAQPSASQTVVLLKGGPASTAAVPAKVSCADAPCETVVLDPDRRLAKRTKYTFRIEGSGDADSLSVADLAGNELAQDYLKSFKTRDR